MAESQETHWWYRGRRLLLERLLQAYLRSTSGGPDLLEIGAGTGSNLPVLAQCGSVTAVEPASFAANHLINRFPDVVCVRATWPAAGESLGQFDAVVLMDVLEHLEDDVEALRAVHRNLKPGGVVIISVPAYRTLWSEHDELLWHKRRYSRRELQDLCNAAGFHAIAVSGFNSLLLPIAWMARKLKLGFATGDAKPPTVINAILTLVLGIEATAIASGIRAPFGLSLVAVLRSHAQ